MASTPGTSAGGLDAPTWLAALGRASALADAGASLEAVARAVVEDVCAATGWAAGRLLLAADGRLVPTDVRHVLKPSAAFDGLLDGVGALAARALASGLPVWAATEPWPAAAVPVRAAGGVVGVLEFACAAEAGRPAPAVLDAVATAAGQVGRVADRDRAEASADEARRILDASTDAFVALDASGLVAEWSRQAEAMFGWSAADARGRRLTELVVPARHREASERGVARVLAGHEPDPVRREVTAVHRTGTEFPVELSVWARGEGPSRRVCGLVRDLSERKRFEGQLAAQALHDRLTGLPNRVLLHDRVEHAVARAGRRGVSVALLVADLDRFKLVNESLGHDGGDRLLVAVAERLCEILRPGDTVARMGGDEFALLCEDVAGAEEAESIAARVLGAFERPFDVKGTDVSLTTSVGVALAPVQGPDTDLLLRDADVAMYRAKKRGRGRYEVFDESMLAEAAERLSVENDLRRAIRHGQLRLFYQPIVALDSGLIAGFEALVRWQHPERGLLSPADFIPPAEETGLIVPLGRCVLDEACRQAATWQRGGGVGVAAEPLRVSVNVSAKQLAQHGWADEVAQILAQSGLAPRQLVLEITESVLMDDTENVAQRFEELRRLGVRIAIDDFGTGYSSLGYLRRLPVDILKIDKSFIDGVAEGPHESALARAVVKLASTMRLDAVAEGVSSRRQLAALRRLRCPYGQGYLFSRPQPADVVAGLLEVGTLEGDEEG
jgi:diguanylate cyclase (GGDEF)-like protein/PAS domain S-box-containing protein